MRRDACTCCDDAGFPIAARDAPFRSPVFFVHVVLLSGTELRSCW